MLQHCNALQLDLPMATCAFRDGAPLCILCGENRHPVSWRRRSEWRDLPVDGTRAERLEAAFQFESFKGPLVALIDQEPRLWAAYGSVDLSHARSSTPVLVVTGFRPENWFSVNHTCSSRGSVLSCALCRLWLQRTRGSEQSSERQPCAMAFLFEAGHLEVQYCTMCSVQCTCILSRSTTSISAWC